MTRRRSDRPRRPVSWLRAQIRVLVAGVACQTLDDPHGPHRGIMWVTFGHLCPPGHIMPDHGGDIEALRTSMSRAWWTFLFGLHHRVLGDEEGNITVTETGRKGRYCSQHHQPREQCSPQDRHVQSLRCSDELMAQVEAKAATLGLDRNAGVEIALKAFVQDDDDPSAVILQLQSQVAELKTQMAQAAATAAAPRRAAATRLHTQTEQKLVRLTMSNEDKRTDPVTVPLSPREVALIGQVQGKAPTSQWIREAALRELAREFGVETVDTARRSAPRRRNYAERGKIAAKEEAQEL